MKRILPLVCALMFVFGSPAATPEDDFSQNVMAAVSALQHWYDSRTGLWRTTGWWNSANCLEAVEAAATLTGGEKYLPVIRNTFERNLKGNFLNGYYDDEGWWAAAWIHAYDLTAEERYLKMAKTIFQDMTNGWDNHCGGGIWWDKKRTYKNAIPNELFLLVAIRLHQRTPNDNGAESYFSWATTEWSWFRSSGMLNAQNLVNDGLTANCVNNGRTTWTYNQGVILGGLTDLYKVTRDTNYLRQAEVIADAAIHALTEENGVLVEPCKGGCGGGDVPQFKGVFIRNLAYLYDADGKPSYYNVISNCASSIWLKDRDRKNRLGLKWLGPFDSADAARQSSAIMPLAAFARMSHH